MTERLRILLVDDEPLAIERLQMMLRDRNDVEVVGTAVCGEAALAFASEQLPDLCLLDIGMPEMDGIAVARALALTGTPTQVIFVTAYDNFAVAAFNVDAVDYLVKPVDPVRLAHAIGKARQQANRPRSSVAACARYIQEFWASDRGGLIRIGTPDITRITAERDYMRLHSGKRSWLINDSLARLEEQLDPAEFVRLHRGAIVRRSLVTGFRYDDGWFARLADGSEQKVGRAYADNARKLTNRPRR